MLAHTGDKTRLTSFVLQYDLEISLKLVDQLMRLFGLTDYLQCIYFKEELHLLYSACHVGAV